MNQDNERDRRKVRLPSEAFHACPVCRFTKLLKIDGQALCTSCGWNSIAAFVDAGGCDVGNRVISSKTKDTLRQRSTQNSAFALAI